MNGLIVFISMLFLVAGAAYGIGAGTMKSDALEHAALGPLPLRGFIFVVGVLDPWCLSEA